jgi:microcystin-dependent protein
MPSDASGNYSLPPIYLATTGLTIQAVQHNTPLTDIEAGLTARLMRSGAGAMTGPLKLVDGLEGAASLTFNSAQTTGFYKTAAGNIGISIGGVKVAEVNSGGMSRNVGELIALASSVLPAKCVLPQGQTLARSDFPDLWIVAQASIAAGEAFYNNGNGTTTFGIGDARGRVFAHIDGGAGRLPGWVMGTVGGETNHVLSAGELAPHTHSGSGQTNTESNNHNHNLTGPSGNTSTGGGGFPCAGAVTTITTGVENQAWSHSYSLTTNTGNGISGAAHNNVQPTMAVRWALYAGA